MHLALAWSVLALSLVTPSFAMQTQVGITMSETARMHLGQTISVEGTLSVPADVEGKIALSTPPISDIDTLISIEPKEVMITRSQQASQVKFKVSFTTTEKSRSFTDMPMLVLVEPESQPLEPSGHVLQLTVDPLYEIFLMGGGGSAEMWSSPMSLTFPPHDPALTVRFVNQDKAMAHTIHGEGAIPHQSDEMSPDGGFYEVKVLKGRPVMGKYRCHDHEDYDQLRTIQFNAP